MATFIPNNPEDLSETIKILLDLADRSKDVATSTDHGRLAIVVPEYLYKRYVAYQDSGPSNPEPQKKRGPGRPRKNPLPEELA